MHLHGVTQEDPTRATLALAPASQPARGGRKIRGAIHLHAVAQEDPVKNTASHHAHTGGGLMRIAQSGRMRPFRRSLSTPNLSALSLFGNWQKTLHRLLPCASLRSPPVLYTPQGTDVPGGSDWSELPQLQSGWASTHSPRWWRMILATGSAARSRP